MLSKSDKRDIELMNQLKKATSVQEVLETAKALKWDFSEQEAREFLGQTTSEKESPSKGISQEAINTLLDLSITTEEALDKSAEITIREAEEIADLNKPEKESRSDVVHRWSMTNDLQEFVRIGKELHPEITEEFWTLVFKDSYKTKEEAKKQPTLDDFFAAESRQEKEVILQKILGKSLTPEEIDAFFPKDDD